MLRRTSTRRAPRWVISADHKWVTRTPGGGHCHAIDRRLGLEFPVISAALRRRLEAPRRALSTK
jgi:hypothetical protein